ncbi:hypothetical protein [Treponema sp.]|uniref:hypothetical protein n=1 Tax=Treponema sp. TaxID=166 RepID=UPI00298DDE3C|nr:hypothetical protein [Treponema sp.]
MKVLILNGSPRANGNTSLAASEIFSAVGLIALAFLPDLPLGRERWKEWTCNLVA